MPEIGYCTHGAYTQLSSFFTRVRCFSSLENYHQLDFGFSSWRKTTYSELLERSKYNIKEAIKKRLTILIA